METLDTKPGREATYTQTNCREWLLGGSDVEGAGGGGGLLLLD